ncbi:breast cancer anti-estrogen resistance protein 1-like [Babylonia areolata]|uniref:breast cancer anti-estrogen resistance protein 1-like n=1 Tax=Babylonia areolata TaxID=304850 RepID=UPI003FD25D7D
MFLAKALFDNVAESPEELAFRRGDVVTVMAPHEGHRLGGWWLCSFRGRKGIAPANRLKILSGLLTVGEGSGGGGASGDQTDQVVVTKADASPNGHQRHSDCLQDYDVPPSRHPPPPTPGSPSSPSPTPTGPSLYDIPHQRTAAPSTTTTTDFNTQSLPPVPPHTVNSFYDSPPASCKRPPFERNAPWRSFASMDNLFSNSFRTVSSPSGDHHPKFPHKTPMNRKRWSADCGTLMMLAEKDGNERLQGGDGGNLRLSGEVGNNTQPPDSERHNPNPPVRVVVDHVPSDEDETVYSTPPSGQPVKPTREATYDTPHLSTYLSPACVWTRPPGRKLSSASSEPCIAGITSHSAPDRRIVVSAAGLPDSALYGADVSHHKVSSLSARQSCSSTQLPVDTRVRDIPEFSLSTAGTPRPLSDCVTGDRFHLDLKTANSLKHSAGSSQDPLRNCVSEVSLKSPQSDPGSTPAANGAFYDIPPQVNRQSIVSAGSNSSDDSFRLSSCSMDSLSSGAEYYCLAEGLYEELNLDQDSAIQLLMKLQEDVTKSASRVLMFVSSTWRAKEFLQSNVYDIKTACVDLEATARKLVEFGQGTLVNSTHLSDRKLVNRLVKQVNRLQKQHKAVSEALHCLDDMQWEVSTLAEPLNPNHKDHLDTVVSLTKEMTPEMKKLVSLICGNSSLFFKRSPAVTSGGSETVHSMSSSSSTSQLKQQDTATPRSVSVQLRPLPPLPVSASAMQMAGGQNSLNSEISVAEEGMRRCTVADTDDDYDRDYTDVQDDYDYVLLEACDSGAQQTRTPQLQHQSEQTQHMLENIDEEMEHSDSIRTDKTQSVAVYTIPEKGTYDGITGPTEPIHHTETVSACLGKKYANTDKTQAFQQTGVTSASGYCPNGQLTYEPHLHQDLGTPACRTNSPQTPPPQDPPSQGGSGITHTTTADPGDKQVLHYYSGQLETHSTLLTNAIDAFAACVKDKEPPNVFISNSKFVIITAYKLIYIADALHRRLVDVEVRNNVVRCADQLCQRLRESVQATKTAASLFPSATAVQQMMDKVVDVSRAAQELRLSITQASSAL